MIGKFQSPLPTKEELISLLQMGGGTVVEDGEQTIRIVGSAAAISKRSKKCVTYKWVFDSISNYRLVSLTPYLL